MTEPIVVATSLTVFTAEQQERGPLLAGEEWSVLQALDVMRGKFERFLGALNDQEKLDYVRLQQVKIESQNAVEAGIRKLTEQFERQALGSLRDALNTLTGQDIDPKNARIHTRYLPPSRRVRRTADGPEETVASMTLWDAACLNYDGLTGWSFPGQTGLAHASYLDASINASSADFIALVRNLDIGGQLRELLDQALAAPSSLGGMIMALASAEFEFALIDALKDVATSGVDRPKYQQLKRALTGAVRWGSVEEMLLFIPHGVDNISWRPQFMGLTGQYVGRPRGDSVTIPHIIFSVVGCKGAFSYFPDRPGGALRHYDSHREACEAFHVEFQAFYRTGQVDWLYPLLALRDNVRLKGIVKPVPRPEGLSPQATVLYDLVQWLPKRADVQKVGYVRNTVEKVPVVSLHGCYIKRCRTNLQELAGETTGFMATVGSVFRTVISETLDLLLIPAPGPLKGLGRVRTVAMFAVLVQALIEGGYKAQQGEPAELLQTFTDLADLLISSRLHTRLALSVRRRHQTLYHQLSQPRDRSVEALTSPQLLARMLGDRHASGKAIATVLEASNTPRRTLENVWEGERPSASLIEASQRFDADRLIDWVVSASQADQPPPTRAFEVLGPLLTQLEHWPVETALNIENSQGQLLRRYTKDARRFASQSITVIALENFQFGYSLPRRLTTQLPDAIVALLPAFFSAGAQVLRQQLAARAGELRLDLFEALTRFALASRSTAQGASVSVKKLLPESVVLGYSVPAVIEALQALHPQVSLPRLLGVLEQHPLSAHQQTQLLHSQLQPEALYTALRAARQAARREALVDGIFHARKFDRQTQHWAGEFAAGVLNDSTGQALVVCPAEQPVPYVSKGQKDRTVVVLDHGRGEFSPFDHRTSRAGIRLQGPDSFYKAILIQLSDSERVRLGLEASSAVADFRFLTAKVMLSHRAVNGTFYLYRREIARYASAVDMTGVAPDALGLYRQGTDSYQFIDGACFKVAQAGPTLPWRIQHPLLDDAYAPALTHNGAGAWRHEGEAPLTWDGHQPFRRLGPLLGVWSSQAIDQIQLVSGVTPAILRRVHVRNERPPAILMETVERFAIHQRVKAGVETGRDFYDELIGEIGPESADALVGRAGIGRTDQITVLETKVDLDKPHMERIFFKALCHKSERSSDPLAQVLQRDFPGLTARIAEDLVLNLTPLERRSLEAGRVPLTKTKAIRWWLEYLRKTRAVEGVLLPAAASEDSAKLILQTLPEIEGWPLRLRVEVWERGRLIDSIGPVDGAPKHVLEPIGGQYQAYAPDMHGTLQPTGSPGAFLAVVLSGLPALDRQAVGYDDVSGADQLAQAVGQRLTRKWEFADTQREIGQRPWYKPPRRLADGRIGYPLSGDTERGPQVREQVARLRALYPAKTDEEVLELLRDAGDSVSERNAMIEHLINERNTLDVALRRWQDEVSSDRASTNSRALAVARIQRCWAKEGFTPGVSEELNLDDLDLTSLPAVRAYFGHVTVLSLKNNRLAELPQGFIRGFPGLRVIYFNGNRLTRLPDVEGLSHLAVLNLSNNRLTFNLQDEYRLAALTRLRNLDLSTNPLAQGRRLWLYALTHLRVLSVRNCGLDRLPRGAVSLATLRNFDLRDNQIVELAETDLSIHPEVHRGMNMRGNPLSSEARQLLRRVGERHGQPDIDFGLWEPNASLDQRADRWLALLPPGDVHARQQDWTALLAQPMADYFFELLANIAAYPRFADPEYRAQRESVTRRVWSLIDEALLHDGLERIAFLPSYRYMSGGIDGWLLCLQELELRMLPPRMLSADVQNAGASFLHYYRALRRLDSINQYIARYFERQAVWQACTRIMSYRIALAASLDLPVTLAARFDAPTAIPDAYSVNTLRQRILREEFAMNWPVRVQQEPYWIEFLELKYAARFTAALKRYERPLEMATEKVASGSMTEGQYLNYIATLQAARQIAKNELIQELTLQEWTDFVIA